MNNNNNTQLTAKKKKNLIILRGLSGSGKSTLAQQLRNDRTSKGSKCAVLSADDFFMKNGQYCWHEDKLFAAHRSCQAKANSCMKKQLDTIIIDNTNIRKKEMIPYVALAREYNYFVTIREPDTSWKSDINQLEHTNVHGLNQSQLLRQKSNWDKCTATELWKMTAPKPIENVTRGHIAAKNIRKQEKVTVATTNSTDINESTLVALQSNQERVQALANMYNFSITFKENGSSSTVSLSYPHHNPIFTSSFKGNSFENACANALRNFRPNLFKPKK